MTSKSTKVLAGVAVAALAAAALAAVVNHRMGRKPGAQERARLDELEARLDLAEQPDSDTSQTRTARMLESLHRSEGISVRRLRSWLAGLRNGTLSPEQATVAESDFDALEREADRGGL